MDEQKRKRLRAAVLRHEAQQGGSVNTTKVSVDVGNGTVSAASDGRTVFFPSFVAKTRRPYQGTGTPTTSRHFITYKDVNYVIGADALELSGHNSLMGEALSEDSAYTRYLQDDSFAALLAAVSALHPEAASLDIDLGTGAPLSIYEPHGETISERYVGRHEYAYMGRPRTLTVHRVVVYGEGVEAIRLLDANQQAGKIIIHDIGGRTYGVVYYNDGTLKKTRAFDNGIDRLFTDIPIISSDPGARWLIQGEMRRNPQAYPAIRKELNTSIIDTLKTIETKLRIDQADRHVVMGGGAVYAAPLIKARYGKPVVTLNKGAPEMVNALAYARAIEVL